MWHEKVLTMSKREQDLFTSLVQHHGDSAAAGRWRGPIHHLVMGFVDAGWFPLVGGAVLHQLQLYLSFFEIYRGLLARASKPCFAEFHRKYWSR